MHISLFQIVQAVILLVILFYLIYYVYTILFDKNYQPKAWQHAVKSGQISRELKKVERNYPDKVRFFNFWFQVERLKKDKISGKFAELGVYKGDSAHLLHLMDKTREFYLFDTFEGFKQKDLQKETGKAATYTETNFADTSLHRVKQRLNAPVFKFFKGYFPETAQNIKHEQYALVNIDADLYNPTQAGLEYFYPRLAKGGVIIIHDYTPDWPGIVKAVDEYCNKHAIIKVLLPDMDGTVMIFKY